MRSIPAPRQTRAFATRRDTTMALGLMLCALLAGCTGAPEADGGLGGPDGAPVGGARGGEPARHARALLLHPLAANVSHPLWANGTFQAVDACNPVGCTLDTFRHATPIAEHMPAGIATRIHAELKFTSGPVSIGPPLFLYATGGGTVYRYDYIRESAGDQRLDLLVMEEEPSVAIVVDTYWPTFQGAATDYTLRIDIDAANATTPAGVPVEAQLEAGQWITATSPGAKGFTLLLYGPDDRLAGRHVATGDRLDLQLPERDGRYVLVAVGGAEEVGYVTNGTATGLRTLGLSFDRGAARAATTHQPVEWTFEVEGDPLTVGVYISVAETPGGYFHSLDEAVTLSSPEGTVDEDTFSCTVCLKFVPGETVFGTAAPVGDPKLVPGSYTARYEPQGSAGLEVGEFVVRYAR